MKMSYSSIRLGEFRAGSMHQESRMEGGSHAHPVERKGQAGLSVDFLYWEDCPSHDHALERLKEVLAEEGLDLVATVIRVPTQQEAERLQFIGSPTIRVNGRDIDPAGLTGQPFGLNCRIYRHDDGRFSPLPSRETIRRALRPERH